MCWYLWNRNRNRNETDHANLSTNTSLVWEPPPLQWVKVNVDATYDMQIGISQSGVIIRREDGSIIVTAVKREVGIECVVLAELKALAFGVEIAKQFHCSRTIFESDSLTSIKEIRRGKASFSPWDAMVNEICMEVLGLQDYSFQFVPRGANQLAHAVAHVSTGGNLNYVWAASLPSGITNMDVIDNELTNNE